MLNHTTNYNNVNSQDPYFSSDDLLTFIKLAEKNPSYARPGQLERWKRAYQDALQREAAARAGQGAAPDPLAALAEAGVLFTRVAKGAKAPIDADWPKHGHDLAAAKAWAARGGNIGALTGSQSNGLACFDLDQNFAVCLQAYPQFAGAYTVTRAGAPDRGKILFRTSDGAVRHRKHVKLELYGNSSAGGGGNVVISGTHPSGAAYQLTGAGLPRLTVAEAAAIFDQWTGAGARPGAGAGAKAADAGAAPKDYNPRLRAYGQKALAGELNRLAAATKGGRNNALNLAAYNLGRIIGAGALTWQAVYDALLTTGQAIGLTLAEVTATVNSGMGAGLKNPRIIDPFTAWGFEDPAPEPEAADAGAAPDPDPAPEAEYICALHLSRAKTKSIYLGIRNGKVTGRGMIVRCHKNQCPVCAAIKDRNTLRKIQKWAPGKQFDVKVIDLAARISETRKLRRAGAQYIALAGKGDKYGRLLLATVGPDGALDADGLTGEILPWLDGTPEDRYGARARLFTYSAGLFKAENEAGAGDGHFQPYENGEDKAKGDHVPDGLQYYVGKSHKIDLTVGELRRALAALGVQSFIKWGAVYFTMTFEQAISFCETVLEGATSGASGGAGGIPWEKAAA